MNGVFPEAKLSLAEADPEVYELVKVNTRDSTYTLTYTHYQHDFIMHHLYRCLVISSIGRKSTWHCTSGSFVFIRPRKHLPTVLCVFIYAFRTCLYAVHLVCLTCLACMTRRRRLSLSLSLSEMSSRPPRPPPLFPLLHTATKLTQWLLTATTNYHY